MLNESAPLPSYMNDDDNCSSDDTLPLGSPQRASIRHQVYNLESRSNSPTISEQASTSAKKPELNFSLANVKVEKVF